MIRPRFLIFFVGSMLLLVGVLSPGPRGARPVPAVQETLTDPDAASGGLPVTKGAHPAAQRAGTSCVLHVEAFSSFAGPADVTTPDLIVRWCLNGASVSSSGFCPSGNALRLNAPGHAPRMLLRRPGGSCDTMTISFTYAQFALAGTRVYIWPTNDLTMQCSAPPGAVGILLDVTGGICTSFTQTINVHGAGGVYVRFDHGSNTNAILIDDLVVSATGCCGTGNCCEPGPPGVPGCGDPDVEACVCRSDPFCCQVEWDALCAQAAGTLECGACGGSACERGLAVDFGTVFQGGTVCTLFPGVFEECVGAGPWISSAGPCGGSGDMVMRFGEGFPHSAAVTRCIDLTALPSPKLSFSWTKNPGTLGPTVALSVGDGAFQTLWTAPTSFGGGCASTVLDLSAWADEPRVRLRFASGSSVHNAAAFDDIMLMTGGGPHDCCSTGSAGCDDPIVEACVCAIDSFCCEVAWDELCILQAEYFGCANCGLCSATWETDFGSEFLPGSVCSVFPELFEACEGTGPFLGVTGTCMGPGDAAMVFISGDVPSAAISRCLDLTGDERAALRFRHGVSGTSPHPVVEISLDLGGTWTPIWAAPSSSGPGCHAACVDLSPWTGLSLVYLRLRSGGASGGAVIDDLRLVRGEPCDMLSGDLNGDGIVNAADLLLLLSHWGPCPASGRCTGDLDGSGEVNSADLLLLFEMWTLPGP